jgi:CRISPR type III-B/RAMP module RAMP protein Cmr1
MITHTFHLSFITPCFCAGASPDVAELRAPSIRGKLRWWFRVLGGSPALESEVFGSVAGDAGTSSSLIVRVRAPEAPKKWQPINFTPMSNAGYLLYFAKASGKGQRWVPTGALPERTSFEMILVWRRSPSKAARELFDLALDAFLLLGSLGLRSTRGLGCFECKERPFSSDLFKQTLTRIRSAAPSFIAEAGSYHGPADGLIGALGAQLRGLRTGFSAGKPGQSKPTPLGSSLPRQASAVHMRPVRISESSYGIVVFEAPADRVLGPQSRFGAPRLKQGIPDPIVQMKSKYS